MRRVHDRAGYVADPHTAVALAAADRIDLPDGEVVILSTAHPIKFAETVRQALGAMPTGLSGSDGIAPAQESTPSLPVDEASVQRLIAEMAASRESPEGNRQR
jgi:threonine synthase